MRYITNEPLQEIKNKRHKDMTKTKLTDFKFTPTMINTNKTKHETKV